MLKKISFMIIPHYPEKIKNFLKVSKGVSEKYWSKDCYETMGFSNGFVP